MYGSDARYTHSWVSSISLSAAAISSTSSRRTLCPSAVAYFRWCGRKGRTIRYPGRRGSHHAPDNALYTHSYIFNFAFVQAQGILTTTHVNPMLDIYLGVDTGVNTTFGNHLDCFNSATTTGPRRFMVVSGLNLLDGALTVAATTHIGPENRM